MATLVYTDASHPDFIALVQELDAELRVRDGADNAFYAQFNTISTIRYAIVAYVDGQPAGCGAIKPFEEGKMEVKRMFTYPAYRGQRVAEQVLTALEAWAAELGAVTCVLETGTRQPEAIRLYERTGYTRIPNYGQYAEVSNSLCFEKQLNQPAS
ncbi:MAG: GNAT family N-acetyltransferase [Bacteroidia bacterium]|nr:GNAT family N-acetyltransferase [Bacteroidia bacterium]